MRSKTKNFRVLGYFCVALFLLLLKIGDVLFEQTQEPPCGFLASFLHYCEARGKGKEKEKKLMILTNVFQLSTTLMRLQKEKDK